MRVRTAALAVVAAIAAGGCQTTQELSAERARDAGSLARRTGLTVRRTNPDVEVGRSVVLQDPNGVAAVVALRNTGRTAEAGVPVSIAVSDARGRRLYRNDAAGLDASLVRVALLPRGREVYWVNDQITAGGRVKRVSARVGLGRGSVPTAIPAMRISGVRLLSDADGAYAEGRIENLSAVVQQRLVISCVARRGDAIVAAGRAVVERLAPRGAPAARFRIFFIGDPRGARLALFAPPTVLR